MENQPDITMESVLNVVRVDFLFASELMNLDEQTIQYILNDLYGERAKVKRPDNPMDRVGAEQEFRTKVKNLIAQQGRSQLNIREKLRTLREKLDKR